MVIHRKNIVAPSQIPISYNGICVTEGLASPTHPDIVPPRLPNTM